jgi:hypothetical protein
MKSSNITAFILMASIASSVACAKPPAELEAADKAAAASGTPADGTAATPPVRPPQTVGKLNYPDYTPEFEKGAKTLKGGDWLPIDIFRPFILLRGGGIKIPKGNYFVQTLADSSGNITRFLLAKKKGIKPDQVNLKAATAPDGSFAAIIEVISKPNFAEDYKESKAYLSGSGESGQIWLHLAKRPDEWRGEIMAWGGPDKPTITQ